MNDWIQTLQAVQGHDTIDVESDSNLSATYSWEPEPRLNAELRVLLLVRNRPGIRPSEIAQELMLDDSEVFSIVEWLNEQGLVGAE